MRDQPLSGTTAQTVTGPSLRTEGILLASAGEWVNLTPAAMVFEALDEGDFGLLTSEAHGMLLGLKVRVASADTLPDGLEAATDYFVIPIDEDRFYLAETLADANNDIAAIPNDAGTGVHTLTPTTLSAISKLQSSVNGSRWTDVTSSDKAISGDANDEHSSTAFPQPLVRCVLTVTAGQLSYQHMIVSK